MIIEQTLNLIFFYEKILYLKMKVLLKEEKLLKILKNKEFIKSNINLLNFVIKENEKIYLKSRQQPNKVILLCYIILLLTI